MEIKLDEQKVTASIQSITNIVNQIEVTQLNLHFSENTVQIAEILPEEVTLLTSALIGLKDVGSSITSDLEECKTAVITMEHTISKEIQSVTPLSLEARKGSSIR